MRWLDLLEKSMIMMDRDKTVSGDLFMEDRITETEDGWSKCNVLFLTANDNHWLAGFPLSMKSPFFLDDFLGHILSNLAICFL